MFGYTRQHARPNFVVVVKREHVIRPALALQRAMRNGLALHSGIFEGLAPHAERLGVPMPQAL